jgi:hypothetical protein
VPVKDKPNNNNKTIRRSNIMTNETTNNKFLVNIIDTKNGGSIGVVWDMTSTEIDNFNADNTFLRAVVIDK